MNWIKRLFYKKETTKKCDIHVVRSSSIFLYKSQHVEGGKKVTFIENVRVDDLEQTITLTLEKGTKVESLNMTMEKAQDIGLINFNALNYF